MIRNASEAVVVRAAIDTGGTTPLSVGAALGRAGHPSNDLILAARAMMDSLQIRGVLDTVYLEGSIRYAPTAAVVKFLAQQDLDLCSMSDEALAEEFGEFHGQHVEPSKPLQVNLASYRAARNAETRAQRQLWQCPSPWDYARRIKDEIND